MWVAMDTVAHARAFGRGCHVKDQGVLEPIQGRAARGVWSHSGLVLKLALAWFPFKTIPFWRAAYKKQTSSCSCSLARGALSRLTGDAQQNQQASSAARERKQGALHSHGVTPAG